MQVTRINHQNLLQVTKFQTNQMLANFSLSVHYITSTKYNISLVK